MSLDRERVVTARKGKRVRPAELCVQTEGGREYVCRTDIAPAPARRKYINKRPVNQTIHRSIHLSSRLGRRASKLQSLSQKASPSTTSNSPLAEQRLLCFLFVCLSVCLFPNDPKKKKARDSGNDSGNITIKKKKKAGRTDMANSKPTVKRKTKQKKKRERKVAKPQALCSQTTVCACV